jgi:hypothetical protein
MKRRCIDLKQSWSQNFHQGRMHTKWPSVPKIPDSKLADPIQNAEKQVITAVGA